MITGNGFYLTKHAASVWSGRPFEGEALRSTRPGPQPSEALETAPRNPVPANGRGTIETYTVVYARDGSPARGIVLGSLDSGERFLANTPPDRSLLEAFVAEEQVGNTGRVTTGESVSVYTPD
jgi:acetyl-CoA C-acetyltransferase